MNCKEYSPNLKVQAFQLTPNERWHRENWPDWLLNAWRKHHSELGAVFPNGDASRGGDENLVVRTPDGPKICKINDFISRDIEGNLKVYPKTAFLNAFVEEK